MLRKCLTDKKEMEKTLNILEEIAAKTRERVAEAKKKISLEDMKRKQRALKAIRDFRLKMPLKREVFLLYVRRKSFTVKGTNSRRFSLCRDCKGI